MTNLWQLADEWEDRWRDKRRIGPIERYTWKQAWLELTAKLGERKLPPIGD